MTSTPTDAGRLILALDLGKYKTTACAYRPDTADARFHTLDTGRDPLARLLRRHRPALVVIEACALAGWVHDLCAELGLPCRVANTASEAWKFKHAKRKTDKDDALRLAQLQALGQLPAVCVPPKPVREWRALIATRQALVGRRVAAQNRVRSVLLGLALADYRHACARVAEAEAKLDALAAADAGVRLLRTAPGVGPRTAEAVVAHLHDPKRFASGKQVSAYGGLVPRQYQSGESDRRGRITRRGPAVLRKLLVECAWCCLRYNAWARGVYQRLSRGRARRKQAVVALARRLLVRLWAMLRDGSAWRGDPEPAPA